MADLVSFTDVFGDEICDSQPLSLPSSNTINDSQADNVHQENNRPHKGTGKQGVFRSVEEIDPKFRNIFTYPYFNLVQSNVIEDALYSDKSIVVCAPTGSGKTVVFEMTIVQLLMELEDMNYNDDFKIIYMAPVKALCTERLTEWYPKLTKLGLLCIEVTGDTNVEFPQLKPYRVIITTPEKWDMLTRRWKDHRGLVEVIKLFLIDEVHILNDEHRGPVLEAVVSRMKTIESSAKSAYRIEKLQRQYQGTAEVCETSTAPKIRFVAVSATVSNPEDVATWLGNSDKPAVFYRFGDECRPVKLKRVVEGYFCPEGTSIFKFDIILNYKLWPIIQKYHNGKPTLIFCNTRKSVVLTAEALSREITVSFSTEQKAKLTALASTIKNKKIQALLLSGVGCHHAGLLYEERMNIELGFRNRDLPILVTTTTLAMGVNLPAHLVIVKNTQQYVNGAYQEYSISTVLQMVGRAGRPQFDTEATAVIMTRAADKARYQALVGGSEPLQSYLHKRLAENLNSEAALGTVGDVAQCVEWLNSTFLSVRAARDPKRYLGLPPSAPAHLISKKIEELCVKAMNGLASCGLITMDEASCIASTEAGRLMSIYYLDVETMKNIMKIKGSETLEQLLGVICNSHELSDMHLRVDERRYLNALNRNNKAATIRFPMKGKISTRQMKLNCIIQAVLGCLPISDPSLIQEAVKIMRIADRICKCLVTYITQPSINGQNPQNYSAVLNSIILAKCIDAQLWENSPYVSKQLKGIGPTFSTLLATAGKTNFNLLEESHPRDLERIMNKGPPAGNLIRKQISLLPSYHLTIIPIDQKSVRIQLMLLNLSYLSENIEHLNAGTNHKTYIIVGDSLNHLLFITSFKDSDLISVYDGIVTYEVIRKYNGEHKITAQCISANIVGIDKQCEYSFQDIEPRVPINIFATNSELKQCNTTDTFKPRKRKVYNTEIAYSKEKIKRDTAIVEKFKRIKESFGIASKEIQGNINKTAEMSNVILNGLIHPSTSRYSGNVVEDISIPENVIENPIEFHQNNISENVDDNFVDDEEIGNILNEIETEINNAKQPLPKPFLQDSITFKNNCKSEPGHRFHANNKTNKIAQRKSNSRSNYEFINLLERNVNLSVEERDSIEDSNSGFSSAVKSQLDIYLQKVQNRPTITDVDLLSMDEKVKNTNICLIPKITNVEKTFITENNEVNDGLNDDAFHAKKETTECFTGDSECYSLVKTINLEEKSLNNYYTKQIQDTNENINAIAAISDEDLSMTCKDKTVEIVKHDENNPKQIVHHQIPELCLDLDTVVNDNLLPKCPYMEPKNIKDPNNTAISISVKQESLHLITAQTSNVSRTDNNKKTSVQNLSFNSNISSATKSKEMHVPPLQFCTSFNKTLSYLSECHVPKNLENLKGLLIKTSTIDIFAKSDLDTHNVRILSKTKLNLDIMQITSRNNKNANSCYLRNEERVKDNLNKALPANLEAKSTDKNLQFHIIENENIDDKSNFIDVGHQKCNTIQNIIEKYKHIMSRKPSQCKDLNIKKRCEVTTPKIIQDETPKRKLKLSEINNINITLPKYLTESPTTASQLQEIFVRDKNIENRGDLNFVHHDLQNKTCNNEIIDFPSFTQLETSENRTNDLNNTTVLTSLCNNSKSIAAEVPITLESENEEKPNTCNKQNEHVFDDSDSPHLLQIEHIEEPEDKIVIDDAIFNPKYLIARLESVCTENIIPPPLEFCDNAYDYSPNRNENNKIHTLHEMDIDKCHDEDPDHDDLPEINTTEKSFQNVDITFPKENEKWIEPCEWVYSKSIHTTPVQSTKTLNIPHCLASRKVKLNNFKFKPKTAFKSSKK